MIPAPAGPPLCPVCSAGGCGCVGHLITSASSLRPLDLPAPPALETAMPLRRELRTLPSGASYYVNVPEEVAPRGKARPAPTVAAPTLAAEVEVVADPTVAGPVTVIADGPAPATPPPGSRRRPRTS